MAQQTVLVLVLVHVTREHAATGGGHHERQGQLSEVMRAGDRTSGASKSPGREDRLVTRNGGKQNLSE